MATRAGLVVCAGVVAVAVCIWAAASAIRDRYRIDHAAQGIVYRIDTWTGEVWRTSRTDAPWALVPAPDAVVARVRLEYDTNQVPSLVVVAQGVTVECALASGSAVEQWEALARRVAVHGRSNAPVHLIWEDPVRR